MPNRPFADSGAIPRGRGRHRTAYPLAGRLAACTLALLLQGASGAAWSQEHGAAAALAVAKKPAAAASSPKEIGEQVREAVQNGIDLKKRPMLMISGKDAKGAGSAIITESKPMSAAAATGHAAAESIHVPPGAIPNPMASRQYIRAKAAALTGHEVAASADGHEAQVHWSYEGANGPQSWGQLKPDFNLCSTGKRQSPINIEESDTLQGPAEAIAFNYSPSGATVLNNGHTIQVDVSGDNRIVVRGSEYQLVQFHFHRPSEERINFQGFAMVAHLVHRNAEGQLAVVAVLLEAGAANPLIHKVWTYMPLETNDRVRMPSGVVELAQLLPQDQRYYQFMGSLTTPPCSEGVLWMVLKQPVTVSNEQLRLFAKLFPNNARPVQAVNGRAVRNAQ